MHAHDQMGNIYFNLFLSVENTLIQEAVFCVFVGMCVVKTKVQARYVPIHCDFIRFGE